MSLNNKTLNKIFIISLILLLILSIKTSYSYQEKQPQKASITIYPEDEIGRINPHIYSHFIEHLGRCIYGGIWAEMLQDRKFAGTDNLRITTREVRNPNELHTSFGPDNPRDVVYGIPVPWTAFGLSDNVKYVHDNTTYYTGKQSQRIEILNSDGEEHGVCQKRISIIKDKKYSCYVILKNGGNIKNVKVSLRSNNKIYGSHIIENPPAEWKKYEFTLTPNATDKSAIFSITFYDKGKLWIGAVSLMPSDNINGLRRDVIEAIKGIHPQVIRWPGGNFVSGYHWKDGIGVRDKRPTRVDMAWFALEPNDFGIDEFIEFIKQVEGIPLVVVNTGNGTAQEAAELVEYCNGSRNTKYGKLRAQNGHPEPYNVKYWGIGNEMYGNWQIGHVDEETYAHRQKKFIEEMRKVDPNIIVIAVGSAGSARGPSQWNKAQLELVGEMIDYYSVHHYTSSGGLGEWRTKYDEPEFSQVTYEHVILDLNNVERLLKYTIESVKSLTPPEKDIKIAYDEWNVWLDWEHAGLEQRYRLRDGIYAAGTFNILHKYPNDITMANIAQLVNVLGVINTNQTQVVKTPLYLAFKLYTEHTGDIAVKSELVCRNLKTRLKSLYEKSSRRTIPEINIPELDISITKNSDNNKLFIAVANRNISQKLKTGIQIFNWEINGTARIYMLNGKDYTSLNTFEKPDEVKITESIIQTISNSFEYEFPPHSVTIIECQKK